MGMEDCKAALFGCGVIVVGLGIGSAEAQQADALAKFYQGKQINVIVFQGPGTTYDVYARLLARHMGRFIPGNPSLIPQNMIGAGGLKATEYLYGIAPKDGSVIGEISPGNPFEPLLGGAKADFDPLKFTWLGSMARNVSVAVSWYTQPFKTVDDLREREMITPGTGAGADSEIIPVALNTLVGTKFKVIPGYPGIANAALAMERGEIDGIGYWAWTGVKSSHPDWIRDHKLNIIYHTSAQDQPELPGVSKIRDFANSEMDRKALDLLLAREILGRPFLAPPDLPAERAQVLRAAFVKALKDKDLLADAEKVQADIDVVTPDEVTGLLKQVFAYSQDVVDRAKEALSRASKAN
jgi:tripartite-type tricarboxylate transporter receptor subunit TctC